MLENGDADVDEIDILPGVDATTDVFAIVFGSNLIILFAVAVAAAISAVESRFCFREFISIKFSKSVGVGCGLISAVGSVFIGEGFNGESLFILELSMDDSSADVDDATSCT